LSGVDMDRRFIKYAQEKYTGIKFEIANILKWKAKERYDLILCTGGLHHLPFEEQEKFVRTIKDLLNKGGFCIIADPCIDDYSNEKERKLGASKLGYEYLSTVIENDAPKEIILAAIDILHNDVMKFEFKNSVKKNKPIFEKYFSSVEVHKTWPKSDSEYGDYFFVLRD
ncbi:MAG: class I SAM-dependent methyltransferase, partial [Nanoarchaeota archaeon]|nr:class I SAM-dependent methyltransferase [Nanoarchaeota archaeon]